MGEFGLRQIREAQVRARTPAAPGFPERWSLCLAAWTQRNPAAGQRSPADPVLFLFDLPLLRVGLVAGGEVQYALRFW